MKKKINSLVQQFPNIFRFIPEKDFANALLKSKPLFYTVSVVSLSVILLIFLLVVFYLYQIFANSKKLILLTNNRQQIKDKIIFWQSIADKYEGYKDAYFQMAVLQYSLGDNKDALINNNKALLLDPNFTDAKKLNVLLDDK